MKDNIIDFKGLSDEDLLSTCTKYQTALNNMIVLEKSMEDFLDELEQIYEEIESRDLRGE